MLKKSITIQDLHDDILVYVFEALALTDPPHALGVNYRPDAMSTISGSLYSLRRRKKPTSRRANIHQYHLGWIYATHVCRRWRTILLSLSSLWAGIVCHLPHVFDLLLDRARDASLNFDVRQLEGIDLVVLFPIIDYALENIDRARTLNCPFFRQQCEKARDSLSGRVLPNIVCLDISRPHPRVQHRFLYEEDDGLIAGDILRIDAPNLRTATLSEIRCYFTSPFLRSLQYLECGDDIDLHGYLFEVLRSVPMLESLRCKIGAESAGSQSASPATHEVIGLPHLKYICAWSTWSRDQTQGEAYRDAADFFRHISIPPTCDFHYKESSRPSNIGGWRTPFDTCGHRLRQLPYNAVSIQASDMWETCAYHVNVFFTHECNKPFGHFVAPYTGSYACCTERIPGRSGGRFLAPGVRLGVEEPYDPEDLAIGGHNRWSFPTVLPGIISYLRHDMITHLALNRIEYSFGSQDADRSLVVALQPFTAVTMLSVIAAGNDILRALAKGGIEGEQLVLPALRDLTVALEVDYGTDLEKTWDAQHCIAWWEPILAFLEQRQRDNVPICALRLTGWWEHESVRQRAEAEDNERMQSARELVEKLIDGRITEDVSHNI
ncbi:hypothetical protein PENSPDRAFT_652142 [Peniophora sp. CONT]|nr:hypothetical protein PENSPDRAFT_652142 [Peniophora sp. CONT]